MKNLNVKKLLKTDFIERFLGFVEKYETVRDVNLFETAYKWISTMDFDCVKSFLHTIPVEYSLPFTITDFVYMSYDDFLQFQGKSTEILALLDEKKSLYQELLSFYE